MNERDRTESEIERLLGQARPTEPSTELKAHIIGAAQQAWKEAPADVPWQIAIRRLAAAAAAAVLIVSLANVYGDHVSRYQPSASRRVVCLDGADLDAWPDAIYGPLARRLMAAHRTSRPGASALLDYIEKTHEHLSEMEEDNTPAGPASVERRSRLFSAPSYHHS